MTMTVMTEEVPKAETSTNKRNGRLIPESKSMIRGMSFTPFISFAEFGIKKCNRPLKVTPCGEEGLRRLSDLAVGLKPECISPVLVPSTDVSTTTDLVGETIERAIAQSHPWWKELFPTSPMTFSIRCCEKHLRVVNQGDIIVFSTKSFKYRGKDCLLCMEAGEAFGEFEVGCIPISRKVNSKIWILFDRQYPR
jgi:hypothetical protein